MPEVGRVLGGRYRLIELLGEGGMATIYRAHDNQLNRDVAVKLLRPQYGRDPGFIARFRHEAQAAASLNHPNVVNVYDYGTDEAGPFIVMELVDGQNLAEILRERGFLPPSAAASVAAQVAEALEVAHERGIVHRDVKPSNILVTSGGRVKVVDFGIARALAEAQLTLPGMTLGSVHYFSPEQTRGEPVTAASDVYALGLVLYEALTGRRAWNGDTAQAVALARLGNPPPVPSAARPDVPPALDAIVAKALVLDPGGRFVSAGAMAAALRAFLADPAAAPQLGPTAPVGTAGAVAAGAVAAGAAAGGGAGGAAAVGAAAPPVGPTPGPGAVPADLPARVPVAVAPSTGTRAGNVPGRPPVPHPQAQRPAARYGAVGGAPIEPEFDEPRGGGSAWTWIAGILALLVLLLAGAAAALFLSRGFGFGAGSSSVPDVRVPSFIGQQLAAAQQAAQGYGVQLAIGDIASPGQGQADNTIIAQNMTAGTSVPRGTTILVTIVKGTGTVAVPNIIGLPEQQALATLTQNDLKPGARSQRYDPTAPKGQVVDQAPTQGQVVVPGSPVNYWVSQGPEPTPTPTATPSPTPAPPSPAPTELPTPTPTPEITPPPSVGPSPSPLPS